MVMILSAVLLVHCQYTCRRRNIRVKLYEISIHLYLDLIEFLYIHKSPYVEIFYFLNICTVYFLRLHAWIPIFCGAAVWGLTAQTFPRWDSMAAAALVAKEPEKVIDLSWVHGMVKDDGAAAVAILALKDRFCFVTFAN